MPSRLALAHLLLVVAGAACYSPQVDPCQITCGVLARACPSGMTCASDGHCHTPATEDVWCDSDDAALPPDGRTQDASPPDGPGPGPDAGDTWYGPPCASATAGPYATDFTSSLPTQMLTVEADQGFLVTTGSGLLTVRLAGTTWATGRGGATSTGPFRLSKRRLYAQVAHMVDSGGSNSEFFFGVSVDALHKILVEVRAGQVIPVIQDGSTTNLVAAAARPYVATTDVFFQLREQDGWILLETSADGSVWWRLATAVTPGFVANVALRVGAGTWGTYLGDPGWLDVDRIGDCPI